MSIFENIPTCEICQDREPEQKTNGSYKARCKHCSKHYDAQGVAFIIYCEFWRFTCNDHLGDYITFWVFDGKVQKSPTMWGNLVGASVDKLKAIMEANQWALTGIKPPTVQP